MHYFHEDLAREVGINEAIFLQNVYYLSKKKLIKETINNTLDVWVIMSGTTIKKYQGYFTASQIKTFTKNLIESDLLKKEQRCLHGNNSLSYTLTDRAWIIMLYLEKKCERKKFQNSLVEFNQCFWSNIFELWLKEVDYLSNSMDPWLILTKHKQELANIIIEYRTLIEQNRKIEKMPYENLENSIEEIETIISKNLVLKKRIEKTFKEVENYLNEIIIPAIEKYGGLKVVKAFEKMSEEFLPASSPVSNFYVNISELNF